MAEWAALPWIDRTVQAPPVPLNVDAGIATVLAWEISHRFPVLLWWDDVVGDWRDQHGESTPWRHWLAITLPLESGG